MRGPVLVRRSNCRGGSKLWRRSNARHGAMARVYPLELTTIRTPVPCNMPHAPRVRIIDPCNCRCHCPRWLGWVRLGLILVSILRASASAMAMTVAVAIDGFGSKEKREREKSLIFSFLLPQLAQPPVQSWRSPTIWYVGFAEWPSPPFLSQAHRSARSLSRVPCIISTT